MIKGLKYSEILQLFTILITSITAILSIIIATLSLLQNKKMIEESTRPYIIIYSTITNFGGPIYKLVIKNFGQTGGTITKFTPNHDLIDFEFGNAKTQPFGSIENTFIAPGQSMICAIDYKKLMKKDICMLSFNIEYKTNHKTYSENIDINVETFKNHLSPRADSANGELKAISYTLQDLVDKLL